MEQQEQNIASESKPAQATPVPLPRPRQHVKQLEPADPTATAYVNVAVVEPTVPPSINTPVPAPRQRSKVVIFDDREPKSKQGGTPAECDDERYQNVVIIRPAPPSPGKPAGEGSTTKPVNKYPPSSEPNNATGASPDLLLTDNLRDLKINNELKNDAAEEEESRTVGAGDGKYKTLSPGDLFKTIGTASRMLTESIGERVAHKTKKVAHNVRNTGTSLVAWGQESRKSAAGKLLKGVSNKPEKSASLEGTQTGTSAEQQKASSPKAVGAPRPRSLASPDGVMGKIRFDSPLMNNATHVQATYDTPKKSSNLARRSPGSASSSPAQSSHGGSSSVRVSSSSLASSEGGAGAESARGRFERNAPASQSLYSRIIPKRSRGINNHEPVLPSPGQLTRTSKNKSESNLYESIFYVGPPKPTETSDGLYGKLNIIARPTISSSSSSSLLSGGGGSEEDNTTVHESIRIREKTAAISAKHASTVAGDDASSPSRHRIFSRRLSIGEQPQQQNLRSESWNFYDVSTNAGGTGAAGDEAQAEEEEEEEEMSISHISTPEPVYENSVEPYRLLPIADQLEMLQPVPIGEEEATIRLLRHDYDEVSIADIIDEFDPLAGAAGGVSALEGIIEQQRPCGNLALIENLLGEESYSRMPKRVSIADRCPKPPQRSDSLFVSETSAGGAATPTAASAAATVRAVPAKPARRKTRSSIAEQTVSQIIHQNLNLPTGSVDNLVELEERFIEPHLASIAAADDAGPDSGPVDLSYPREPQTSWYVVDGDQQQAQGQVPASNSERFRKRVTVDPINETVDPVAKVSKKPFMAQEEGGDGGGGQPATAIDDLRTSYLPTYFEAIGGTDPLFERGLAGSPAAAAATTKSPSVATKLLNALKRKPSFNKSGDQSSSSSTSTVLTTLEMVPRPKLTERLITHKGHVLKFPSGKIGDVLNELSPRSVVLRERIFQTYIDPQQTLPKEAIHLRHILSVQSILQHKFAGEGRLDLHCFEVVLGVPKGVSSSAGSAGSSSSALAAASASTNPELLITAGTSANVKLVRQSYMFGTHKRSDRNLWMAKILQSVTDVFGGECDLLREFLRAGWCYVKKSVSAAWSGAWLLLAKRKLYLYSFPDDRLEELDLRKARCIGVVDNEPCTIGNLYVESGPSLFIDCPPYTTLYFVMGSPRETQIWHKVIRQVAHKNGPTLHSQQLTRGDVPVLIDKCINFIYAHGSMSEGIYRKSGSQSAVVRILQLFNEDAFNVQLTRNEYNEYDVAGALKKFIRELPGSFFGSYAASFVAIGTLSGDAQSGQQLKLDSYRQLLDRLPRIEYCTLKKLLGHLAFIASLEQHNRMGVPNLAMIWGSVLLANASQNTVQERGGGGYHQQDADVVADLIRLYSSLFPVGADELYREQLMLSVLKKYHAAAENLSDTVKHSGDLKVWITIDCDSAPEEEGLRSGAAGRKNSVGKEVCLNFGAFFL
uniref:Rho-GAP domain-containing protein n=1 Tax=Anopheles maculatus TaxID=74869 RepID=A0A182T275_9DIPT